jgi:hypothetical protein
MNFLNSLLKNAKVKMLHRLMILCSKNPIDSSSFVIFVLIQSKPELAQEIVRTYQVMEWILLIWVFIYIIRMIEYLRGMLAGAKMVYIIITIAMILPPLFLIWLMLIISILHNPDLGVTTITMGCYYFIFISILRILLDASQTKNLRASSIIFFWILLSLVEMGILGIYSAKIDNIIHEIPEGFLESILVFVGYGFNTLTAFGLKVPEKVFLSLICMLGILINKNFIDPLNK